MKIPAVIVGAAFCVPCLVVPLLALGISAGAFSALGAWFSGNGLVLVAAAAVAVAFVAAAGIVYVRRANEVACDIGTRGASQASERSKT